MDYYYVTGTSRGLGRALAERLLQDNDATVIGIARGDGPVHPRYQHVNLDLADLKAVSAFEFPPHPDAQRIALVNNAAFGAVRRVGDADVETIISTLTVDLMTPAILMNSFVAAYRSTPTEMVICNLSARSAKIPVDGSVLYSGAKAALEIMTRVIEREVELSDKLRLKAMCIDPGPMDTDMHAARRRLDQSEFSFADLFRQNYAAGKVSPPGLVAERIHAVLRDPSLAPGPVFVWNEVPQP